MNTLSSYCNPDSAPLFMLNPFAPHPSLRMILSCYNIREVVKWKPHLLVVIDHWKSQPSHFFFKYIYLICALLRPHGLAVFLFLSPVSSEVCLPLPLFLWLELSPKTAQKQEHSTWSYKNCRGCSRERERERATLILYI